MIKFIDTLALFITRHWLAVFIVLYGTWVLLPFAAPVLMHLGQTAPAQAIYFVYSFFCHQLPERSIFFFGPKAMYSLQEIGQVWSTENQMVLRQFIGTPEMGWKMAWSDRMISTYGGIWLGALLLAVFRTRTPRVSLRAWLLVGVLPLLLDGGSHFVNDIVAGSSGLGFRDTNDWLRVLTNDLLPAAFYYGNEFGSFNSWARWLTGLAFGITTVFAIFPIVDESLRETRAAMEQQLERIRQA